MKLKPKTNGIWGMLYFLTETTTEEKINTCTYQHYPLCHWRSQSIQASRHIIINTEQWQENLEWGVGHQVTDTFATIQNASDISMKWCPCNKKDAQNCYIWQHNFLSSHVMSFSMTEKIILMILCSIKKGLQQIGYLLSAELVMPKVHWCPRFTKGHNHCKTLHKYCVPCAS